MHWKKTLKLQSIINISDMVMDDIKQGKNVQLFDINNLNDLLTFKESRNMSKAYYANNLILLKFQLLDINKGAKKALKNFMTR